MEYKFLDSLIDKDDILLPDSEKMNRFLLKNNYADAVKAVDFFATEQKLLYIHGFLGTGKRQFVNYISGFLSKDVIKLEYFCKPSTVCDDILLAFIDKIEKNPISQAVRVNTKVSVLSVKLQQYISSIKKPFLIVIHSFDDLLPENIKLISEIMGGIISNPNVKLIVSTKALMQEVLGSAKIDRKIFLKAFTKEIFKEFVDSSDITYTDAALEDFYKYTRGYYYYTALAIKIIQAMKLDLKDFLGKFVMSGMSFDKYLGMTYVNLIPTTIRNFFWFLRTIRHGMSLNALAVFELYDEFSLKYLISNLMVFEADEVVYVQDYFHQNIDISIPTKTEIRLHKYIINMYEKELKEPLQSRVILISRQALRAEIEYHNQCIADIEANKERTDSPEIMEISQAKPSIKEKTSYVEQDGIETKIFDAKKLLDEKKYTEAIEEYLKIIDENSMDARTLVDIRLDLARVYKQIGDTHKANHYYELAEAYYKQNNEVINLNYLYYELTELYYSTYKTDRAIETIKKVIYSVDTPQSLMVDACRLLGNIYNEQNNSDEAYRYYKKAIESLDEAKAGNELLSDLYFKYALANDDRGNTGTAFEYYTKCIAIGGNNPNKALAYSNMGSCYYDSRNYSDAKGCFLKAYEIEKQNNNYDGIYYTSSYLAKIFEKEDSKDALNYLMEAKQSAEFINEDFLILESTVALGDYYYNNIALNKRALVEYFKARRIAQNLGETVDGSKIEVRINDMRHRMDKEAFEKIEQKYG